MFSDIFTSILGFFSLIPFYFALAETNLNHLDTPQLQSRNFGTAVEGKALSSTLVFLSGNVSDEDGCMLKCLMYQECYSYNLGSRQGQLIVCELCSKETGLAALVSQLVNKTGYKHRKVLIDTDVRIFNPQSGCSSNPCSGEQNICIPDLQTTSAYRCLKPHINIELKAYTHGDPVGPRGNAFLDSYFQVNNKNYPIDKQSRGHSFRLVSFNGTDVNVGPKVTFDSHDDTQAASKMASYINTIPDKSVVLVLVVDNGSNYNDEHALTTIGATSPALSFRNAWAFVGFKGQTKPWIAEKKTADGSGPAFLTARIQLTDLV